MAAGRADCVRVLNLPSAPSGSDWFAVGLATKRSAGAPFELEGAGGKGLGFASTVSLLPSAMLVAVSSACGSVSAAVDAALFKSGGDSESAAACARAVDVLDACLTDSMPPDAADEDPLEAGLAVLEALARLARRGVTSWLQAGTSLPRHSVLRGEARRLVQATGWSDPGFALVVVGRALALVTLGLERAPDASRAHAAVAVVASLAQAVKLRSAHDELYHLLDCWCGTVGVLLAGHAATAAEAATPGVAAITAAASSPDVGLGCATLFSILAPAAGRCGTALYLRRSSGRATVAASEARARDLAAAAAAAAGDEDADADFEVAGAAHPGEMLAWLVGCGFTPGALTRGLVDSEGGSGGAGVPLFDAEAGKHGGGGGGGEEGGGGGEEEGARGGAADWGSAWAAGEAAMAPDREGVADAAGARLPRPASARFEGGSGAHSEDEEEEEEEEEEEDDEEVAGGGRGGGISMDGIDEETMAALGMAAMAGDEDAAALLEALGQGFGGEGGHAGLREMLGSLSPGAHEEHAGGVYDDDDDGAFGEEEAEALHAASAALGIPPELLAMLSQAGPEEAAMMMSQLGLDAAEIEAAFSHLETESPPPRRARDSSARRRTTAKASKRDRRRRR